MTEYCFERTTYMQASLRLQTLSNLTEWLFLLYGNIHLLEEACCAFIYVHFHPFSNYLICNVFHSDCCIFLCHIHICNQIQHFLWKVGLWCYYLFLSAKMHSLICKQFMGALKHWLNSCFFKLMDREDF